MGKEAYQKKLDKLSGDGGDGNFLKWERGKNVRRFFPRYDPKRKSRLYQSEDTFYVEACSHFFGGVPGGIRCLTTKWGGRNENTPSFDTKCPLCRKRNQLVAKVNKKYQRGSEKGKAAYKSVLEEYGARVRYLAVGFDPTDEEPEVGIITFGPQILTQLLVEYTEHGIHFFDVVKGRAMHIVQKHKGGDPRNVEYSVTRGSKREDITEIWEQVREDLPDLEAVAGATMSVEEIEALMKASAYEDDEEEGSKGSRKRDDDEEDGEDEDRDDRADKKPSCFADEDVYDPKDEVCRECSWRKKCKAKIDAASEKDEEDSDAEEESDDEESEAEEDSDAADDSDVDDDEKPGKKKLKIVKDRLRRRGGE